MTSKLDRIQENANKYIVRNCPAYLIEEDYCTCYLEVCSDCIDCVIKQLIEKCKDAQSECSCKDPIKDVDCFECTAGGRAELGTEILQLFDIEEINE